MVSLPCSIPVPPALAPRPRGFFLPSELHVAPCSTMRQVTAWGKWWPNQHVDRKDGMLCSHCGGPNDREVIYGKRRQRYCRKCHAEYARMTRPKYGEMTPEQKQRNNASAWAHQAVKRGDIKRLPCSDCWAEKAEMHHEDYTKPLTVIWLCRRCHLLRHKVEKEHEAVRNLQAGSGQEKVAVRRGISQQRRERNSSGNRRRLLTLRREEQGLETDS